MWTVDCDGLEGDTGESSSEIKVDIDKRETNADFEEADNDVAESSFGVKETVGEGIPWSPYVEQRFPKAISKSLGWD
jgi:hypothetical protein